MGLRHDLVNLGLPESRLKEVGLPANRLDLPAVKINETCDMADFINFHRRDGVQAIVEHHEHIARAVKPSPFGRAADFVDSIQPVELSAQRIVIAIVVLDLEAVSHRLVNDLIDDDASDVVLQIKDIELMRL